jgi:hypothetical protein
MAGSFRTWTEAPAGRGDDRDPAKRPGEDADYTPLGLVASKQRSRPLTTVAEPLTRPEVFSGAIDDRLLIKRQDLVAVR